MRLIIFTSFVILFTLFGCSQKEVKIDIPSKISFVGTYKNNQISLIEGTDNVKVDYEFADCCANYLVDIRSTQKQFGVRLWISQSESGFQTDKKYQDLVNNVFVVGYNKAAQITPGYVTSGLFIDGNGFPYGGKQSIQIDKVFKSISSTDCNCNNEIYWVVYKVKSDECEGVLTLKYKNPCCL